MTEVIAKRRFFHAGKRGIGERFETSSRIAKELASKGLVQVVEDSKDPPRAAGAKPSASPADPVSPQTIALPSKRGGRKKKVEPSL